METNKRWIERAAHLHAACEQLAALTGRDHPVDTLTTTDKAAIIKFFEIAFELSWRTLQYYLRYEGCKTEENASEVLSRALDNGIISNRSLWHDMYRDSNHENYIYNPAEMHHIALRIYNNYVFVLNELDGELRRRAQIL